MRRLLFELAWGECIRVSWILAAGRVTSGASALAGAFRLLEQSCRSRGGSMAWRPIIQPYHGLVVVGLRRQG